VAVSGAQRTGKSFILNHLISRRGIGNSSGANVIIRPYFDSLFSLK